MADQAKSNENLIAEVTALRTEVAHLQTQLLTQSSDMKQAHQARTIFSSPSAELYKLLSLLSQYIYVIELTDEGQWQNLFLSPHFVNLTGYPLSKLQMAWSLWSSKIVHADDRTALAAQLMRVTAGLGSEIEYRLTRADGQVVWVRDKVSVQLSVRSKVVYGIVSDITESKMRETSLAKLLDLSRTLVATHNPSRVLDQAIKAAVKIAPAADRGSLQLLDERAETLYTVATSTAGEHLNDTLTFRPGIGIAGHALSQNQIINVADTLSDKRFVYGSQPLRVRALLVAPLVVKNRLVGTLSLSSEQANAFTPAHETLIQLIADQVAAALENARLFEIQFKAEKELRQSQKLLQSAIDALATQLVIFDEAGQITALNAAWRHYDQASGTDSLTLPLNLCDTDPDRNQELWTAVSEGIRMVTNGERSQFYLEYPCHSEVRRQWFGIRITRFQSGSSSRIVVAREDVTDRKEAEIALHESEAKYRSLIDPLE